jgi:hypothetical protein
MNCGPVDSLKVSTWWGLRLNASGLSGPLASVDYSFLTLDGTREFIEKLPASDDDRDKMAHLNAEVTGWVCLGLAAGIGS